MDFSLLGVLTNYGNGFFLYAFLPQLLFQLLFKGYVWCTGRGRLTREEKQSIQKRLIFMVGFPVFIWYVWTSLEVGNNYYEILQVGYGAEMSQIKRNFRKLSKDYHPDKGGDPLLFIKLRESYETLKDMDDFRPMYNLYGPTVRQECSHCRTAEDYYWNFKFPQQVSFVIGGFFVLWFFGSRFPRFQFAMFMGAILVIESILIFTDPTLPWFIQLLPFELFAALHLLWGIAISAQIMLNNVYSGDDTRSDREILLEMEVNSQNMLNIMHELTIMHDCNLQDPMNRKRVVDLLHRRDLVFKKLSKNPREMECFMVPNQFAFNLEQDKGGKWHLIGEMKNSDESEDKKQR